MRAALMRRVWWCVSCVCFTCLPSLSIAERIYPLDPSHTYQGHGHFAGSSSRVGQQDPSVADASSARKTPGKIENNPELKESRESLNEKLFPRARSSCASHVVGGEKGAPVPVQPQTAPIKRDQGSQASSLATASQGVGGSDAKPNPALNSAEPMTHAVAGTGSAAPTAVAAASHPSEQHQYHYEQYGGRQRVRGFVEDWDGEEADFFKPVEDSQKKQGMSKGKKVAIGAAALGGLWLLGHLGDGGSAEVEGDSSGDPDTRIHFEKGEDGELSIRGTFVH